MENLNRLLEQAKIQISNANYQHELNEIKALYMGKKSPLSEIMKTITHLPLDEKKNTGIRVNEIRSQIEQLIIERRKYLENEEIKQKLFNETIDVTLPGKHFSIGGKHPLTTLIDEVQEFFLGMGYNIVEGPEVELDVFNFEMLNLPKGHPARDMQDSFYITENLLLRTQTSSVQVRAMLELNGEPVKILCPGKTYRRDDDDATHSHQFMQFEGLVVDKNITMSDLKGTLNIFVKKMFGDNHKIRFRPSYFPFTEPSVEVDVSCFKCGGHGCAICKDSGWIEILGAGMVHPNVLEGAGYNPEIYRGFAFGIGIERVAMIRWGIDDIRNLYINDQRFLKQFRRV